MLCEICGERPAEGESEVDGLKLKVCSKCSKFGAKVYRPATQSSTSKPVLRDEKEVEVLPDFAERIRKAREGAGITRKEFAEKINEKQGVIEQIESGKRLPNIQVARKIEKHFSIRLLGSVVQPETKTTSLPELTLGDRVVIKKK